MKKKLLIVAFVIYLIVILISTKCLLDRNEFGVFDTGNSYYICNEKIKEYDSSSLVHFEKDVDYEKMLNEEIYYFNKKYELQYGKLDALDKENGVFGIGGINYDMEYYLGRPDKAYQIVGSILNGITSRTFYLIFVIIPVIGLVIYEIYLFVKYLSHSKDGKETDNDKKTKKKTK